MNLVTGWSLYSVPIHYMRSQFNVHKDKKRLAAGLNHWRVDGRINGKRIREFFETREVALDRARVRNIELENHGHKAADIPDSWRNELLAGIPKLEAIGASLTEAIKFFLAHHDVRSRSITVTQAWTDFKAAKQAQLKAGQFRSASFVSLVKVCSNFECDFGSELIYDINSDQIQNWIDTLKCDDGKPYSPKSKASYCQTVSGLFTYCIKRNWIKIHPMKGGKIDSGYRVNNAKRPGIFVAEQAAKLLEVADPEILPVVAIGLFCGLRPYEIHRLEWSEVHWHSNQIDVLAENSKTVQYRYVPMPANLIEWLAPYRNASGRVFAQSISSMHAKLSAAGKAAGIAKWPNDVLRHSYGSHRFAQTKNLAETLTDMGHENSKTFLRHYNNRRNQDEGLAYFNIRPVAVQELLVAA